MTKLSEVLSVIEKCSYHGRATPSLNVFGNFTIQFRGTDKYRESCRSNG